MKSLVMLFESLLAVGLILGCLQANAGGLSYPKELQDHCFRLEGVKMKCGGLYIPTPAPGDGGGGGGGDEGPPSPPPVCQKRLCTYYGYEVVTGTVLVSSSVKSTSISCTPNQLPVRDGCAQACDCQNVDQDCNAIDLCPGQHAGACSCVKSTYEVDNSVISKKDGVQCLKPKSISVEQPDCSCQSPPPGYGEPPPQICHCDSVCANP